MANAAVVAANGGLFLFECEDKVVDVSQDLVRQLHISMAQAKRDVEDLQKLTRRINRNLVRRGALTANNLQANQILVNIAQQLSARFANHLALLRETVTACEEDTNLLMREFNIALSTLNGGANFQ